MSAMASRAARNREHNQMVWRKLAFFTLLMVTLPLGTFYGVKKLIGPDQRHSDMWSGFAAVLMVNIVIGLYILSAFLESDEKEVAPAIGRFATRAKQE
ncbi:hypothetical protein Poli38472_002353 [Pythium oligandrum]|uniref:Vacuolar ATPase assembly integral membrane protein VMA21 homolog n=1 Tax=Pythium oligandrum TaxID=41045 RepID=A0A8K1CHD0_PYTOL|nr:hypothetical protein Poli38472_002353 [Pythium oligandrum]|eukprot:TMW63412.1 hypothetical protein Poli38472_002353 [Pythium oligandrum]